MVSAATVGWAVHNVLHIAQVVLDTEVSGSGRIGKAAVMRVKI